MGRGPITNRREQPPYSHFTAPTAFTSDAILTCRATDKITIPYLIINTSKNTRAPIPAYQDHRPKVNQNY